MSESPAWLLNTEPSGFTSVTESVVAALGISFSNCLFTSFIKSSIQDLFLRSIHLPIFWITNSEASRPLGNPPTPSATARHTSPVSISKMPIASSLTPDCPGQGWVKTTACPESRTTTCGASRRSPLRHIGVCKILDSAIGCATYCHSINSKCWHSWPALLNSFAMRERFKPLQISLTSCG